MKVFLDLDGTILDVSYRCYRLYFNILTYGGFDVLDMRDYWTLKRANVSEKEIASRTTPPVFAEYYVRKRLSLIDTMDYLVLDKVLDGVYETLGKWSLDHDLYIVTARQNRLNLDRQLFLFDVHRYFKFIYSAGPQRVKKEKLIRHEVSDKTNCIIIGDTEQDIEAGKALGITTVAVGTGVRERFELEKMKPDIFVESIVYLDDMNILYKVGNINGNKK